jgi:hypothetical protein
MYSDGKKTKGAADKGTKFKPIPILLYGAPVWVEAMKIESYKSKLIRVQKIIKIKMAKAYRTV